MIKNFIRIALFATIIAGCGKTIDYSQPNVSTATFINVSPSAPIFNIIVDNVNQTINPIAYRGNSGFLNIVPGTRNINVRANNPAVVIDYVSFPSESFEANKSATYVIYDTLATLTSKLKVAKLKDTLTPLADGLVKFRYFNAAPNAVPLDITFVRTSVSPNDSVTFFNRAYLGATPSEATINSASTFVTLPGGTYAIRQKIAGTQTLVVPQNTFSPNVAGIFKGYYTFYTSGTAASQPLALGVIRQVP